jgi:hypothetical protein
MTLQNKKSKRLSIARVIFNYLPFVLYCSLLSISETFLLRLFPRFKIASFFLDRSTSSYSTLVPLKSVFATIMKRSGARSLCPSQIFLHATPFLPLVSCSETSGDSSENLKFSAIHASIMIIIVTLLQIERS